MRLKLLFGLTTIPRIVALLIIVIIDNLKTILSIALTIVSLLFLTFYSLSNITSYSNVATILSISYALLSLVFSSLFFFLSFFNITLLNLSVFLSLVDFILKSCTRFLIFFRLITRVDPYLQKTSPFGIFFV